MRLAFQSGQARGLDAVYHFDFTGAQAAQAKVTIRNRTLKVEDGFVGQPNLIVTAEGEARLKLLAKEVGLVRLLLTRKIRLKARRSCS